jgi:hypothetical protein
MKSSIRTRSRPEISLGPRAALPFVILTRLTSGNPKSTPRNEKVWSPSAQGTKNVPRSWLLAPKNVNDVVFGRSTSVKMAPKPLGRVLINAASRSAASVVQKIELAAVADQAYYKEKLA